MAIRIRPVADLAKKYSARATVAAPDYKIGVEQAGADWEQQTIAGEGNYETGVAQAIGRKAYVKGVRNAGAAFYVKRAGEVGSVRYGPGVQAGVDRWSQNTQPYLQALAAMTLPPPGPKRSPQNQARANFVAQELGKMAEMK